jgi:cytochrome bd ubiquinol oxidase subunit I
LSAEEKIQRGRKAITTLAEYRKLKAFNGNDKRLPVLAEELKKDMPYFGYGYIKDRAELVPYIPINFYAFRIMVGIGSLLQVF